MCCLIVISFVVLLVLSCVFLVVLVAFNLIYLHICMRCCFGLLLLTAFLGRVVCCLCLSCWLLAFCCCAVCFAVFACLDDVVFGLYWLACSLK